MKRVLILVAAIVLSLGIWKWQSRRSNWQIAMEKSPTITIYSLMPTLSTPASQMKSVESLEYLARYPVLGKVSVSDEADKKKIIAGFRSAFSSGGDSASCFNPRHAISTADNKTTVLICYECGYAEIRDGGKNDLIEIGSGGQQAIEALWQKYGLKSDTNLKP